MNDADGSRLTQECVTRDGKAKIAQSLLPHAHVSPRFKELQMRRHTHICKTRLCNRTNHAQSVAHRRRCWHNDALFARSGALLCQGYAAMVHRAASCDERRQVVSMKRLHPYESG
jgi:hypothetical protein